MATILTMVPPGKQNLSNEKKKKKRKSEDRLKVTIEYLLKIYIAELYNISFFKVG